MDIKTHTHKYPISREPHAHLKLDLDQGFHFEATRLAHALPGERRAIRVTGVQLNASARLPQVTRIERVREALEATSHPMSPLV